MSAPRLAALGAAAASALAAGCADVGGGATNVVSLGFDTSTVSVVTGDTLRDTLGRPLALRAAPFNAAGDTIAETQVPVTFVLAPTDTGVLALAGPLVLGGRVRDTPARVFAAAGGLQSLPKSVDVIRRPTALADTTARDSVRYLPPGSSTEGSAVSSGVPLALVRADSAATRLPVRRVVVRYAVERAAPRVADSVALLDERAIGRSITGAPFIPRSALDTSDASGVTGRRVLLFLRPNTTATDTVVVRATIAYPTVYGGGVADDTVRVRIPVAPRAATP